MMNLVLLLGLLLWAAVGVPYGIKVYREWLTAGNDQQASVIRGVLRGICWPVEQAVKAALRLWKLV